MSSWRDQISEAAQAELDGLLEPAWDFAETRLVQDGSFVPFALVVEDSGEQSLAAADTGNDQPDAAEVVDVLNAGLIERSSELRATAVVADVHLPDLGTDAIRLTLEHREGAALEIVIPYRIQVPGHVGFGDLLVNDTERVIWAQ